jgi:hypothetical protein
MKPRTVLATLLLLVLFGAAGGFYFYHSFIAQPQQAASTCGDPASISSHVYDAKRLKVLKSCITVSGTVALLEQNPDGDLHLRLSLDPAYSNLINGNNVQYQESDLVVEIICVGQITYAGAAPACQNYTNIIPEPNVGEHITVSGPYVLDLHDHNWTEIHPVYALSISGFSPSASVDISENLEISYPNGATTGWLGPSTRSLVQDGRIDPTNKFTVELFDLNNTSGSTQNVTSITISTLGVSIVQVSPMLPFSYGPGSTVHIDVTFQITDAYYHGPLDIQVSSS